MRQAEGKGRLTLLDVLWCSCACRLVASSLLLPQQVWTDGVMLMPLLLLLPLLLVVKQLRLPPHLLVLMVTGSCAACSALPRP